MVVRLTNSEKIKKVRQALRIINYSIDKDVSIASSSKSHKKNRRFVYDVHRRWIKKNNSAIPVELVVEFKNKFNPK
jgi:hypothetical protein